MVRWTLYNSWPVTCREDSWVVVPIQSLCNPEQEMEGTRLTLVKIPNQPDAFEFSIRTPVTPSRWEQFETDLSSAWAKIIEGLQGGRSPYLPPMSIDFSCAEDNCSLVCKGFQFVCLYR